MNLGKVTRGVALAAFATSALFANAQTVNMWWNKNGDADSLQPATVDVLAGSTVTLNVYLKTTGFANNLSAISVLFGFDTSTSSTDSAVPAGSGLSVAHSGTNSAPTGIAMAWNTGAFPGGSIINKFGGGFDPSAAVRPWGLWTSDLTIGDFGFATTPSTGTKMFSVDVTVSGSLNPGDLRAISLYTSPGQTGAWDSNVSDSNSVMIFPQTYTANLRVINPVPEPAAFAVLGLGAVALIRRRRK